MEKDFSTEELNEQKKFTAPIQDNVEDNSKNMFLEFLAKHYKKVLLLMSFLIVIYLNNLSIKKDFENVLNNKDEVIKNLKIESSKKTDIEFFWWLADEHWKKAESILNDINSLKSKIWELESNYEIETLKKNCFKDQVNRMIDKLDYSKDFCEEPQNLEKYKIVK